MTAGWRLDISVTVNDVSAAERLKNVAPGASPGYAWRETLSPEGAKDVRRVFRPSGAGFNTNTNPGLRPGLRSCAAPRRFGGPRSASATARSLKKIDRRYSVTILVK